MEISVLDRQKAVLQRLYHSQAQVWPNQVDLIDQHYNMSYPMLFDHHQSNCNNNNNNDDNASSMARVESSNYQERHCNSGSFISSRENNNVFCSIKKRKAEHDVEDECIPPKGVKKIEPEKSQSAITTKHEKASSINTDKSKVSDVQKPDYIHVRARRGQATDSHSLAERARREKISKKMKCLQELVPGCNRATGKAGMLDEIINYVQSLQKQVEFLSMKLAVSNPRLDFSIDDFFAKEMPAYIASLPTAIQQEAVDSMCLQLNNNVNSNHGFDMVMNHHQSHPITQKSSLTSSMQIPESFLDPSFIHQLQQTTGWESDSPNLYNIGLQ